MDNVLVVELCIMTSITSNHTNNNNHNNNRKKFSLAVESAGTNSYPDSDRESPRSVSNQPLTAFLVDLSHSHIDKSTPCLQKEPISTSSSTCSVNLLNSTSLRPNSVPPLRKAKSLSDSIPLASIRTLNGNEASKYSICDLNSLHQKIHCRRSSLPEPNTNTCRYFTEDQIELNTNTFRNHHRKPSVSLRFQNPKYIDDSLHS